MNFIMTLISENEKDWKEKRTSENELKEIHKQGMTLPPSTSYLPDKCFWI